MNGIMKNEGIAGTERFASPGKGRGLRAVKHFAVGDLVFACPAYSYVLTVNERGAHCEYCFTRYGTAVKTRRVWCYIIYIISTTSVCGSIKLSG